MTDESTNNHQNNTNNNNSAQVEQWLANKLVGEVSQVITPLCLLTPVAVVGVEFGATFDEIVARHARRRGLEHARRTAQAALSLCTPCAAAFHRMPVFCSRFEFYLASLRARQLSEFGHLAQQILALATADADDWGRSRPAERHLCHQTSLCIALAQVRSTALLLSAFVVAAPNAASSPDAVSAADSLAQMERDSPDFAAIVAQVAEAWSSNVRQSDLPSRFFLIPLYSRRTLFRLNLHIWIRLFSARAVDDWLPTLLVRRCTFARPTRSMPRSLPPCRMRPARRSAPLPVPQAVRRAPVPCYRARRPMCARFRARPQRRRRRRARVRRCLRRSDSIRRSPRQLRRAHRWRRSTR